MTTQGQAEATARHARIVSIAWEPTPRQWSLLSCPVFEVFFGGAAGGGKSDALLFDALGMPENLVTLPSYRALIIRRSFAELQELIDRSREYYPAAYPGARYNEQKKRWTFPGGGRVEFGFVGNDADVYRYQGQEYSYIGWDELTHFSLFAYLYLMSRVRSTDTRIPLRVRSTGNPGGKGHAWVKARFIDPAAPMTVIRDEAGRERVFIPSTLADNPHLNRMEKDADGNDRPSAYSLTLSLLPDADHKALALGDWNAYQGSVFNLEPGVHRWTWEQFKAHTGHDRPPVEWRRYRSYDHGFAAPGACYWYAVDRQGRAFAYRELYTVAKDAKGATVANKGASLPPRDVARMIALRSEGEHYAASWTGRDLFDEVRGDHSGGLKLASHFSAEGVHFTAWTVGPGSRLAGKQALHQRLALAADGFPMLIFIEDECEHAIRTLPALEYAKNNPEQVDDSGEDHCFDSIAGFCKMNPLPAAKPKEQQPKWLSSRPVRSGYVG